MVSGDGRAPDEHEVDGAAQDHPEPEHVEFAVRPYTLTGGRTRPSSDALPFEALVEAVAEPVVSMTPERRRILELARDQYVSIAELSAHLHLPLGVVRVVVGDLVEVGDVRVHGVRRATTSTEPSSTISVLESVLHGIFSL
ncbi:DUF742 domain-containing protein [Kineococcus sp. R8]|nr:DUF742 domain-containing protein [Kineococcus siccus]